MNTAQSSPTRPATNGTPTTATSPYRLNEQQRLRFFEDGYLVLRGIVPEYLTRMARRAINAHLGKNGMHPDQLPEMRAQTYCRELTKDPLFLDIARATPLASIAETLFGEGNMAPVGGAQIALRFPQISDRTRPPVGHLDGIGTGTNGIPVGEFRRGFTMLAVVLLQDVPEEYMGSFTVWPGSHRFFEDFFKDPSRDPKILAQGMPTAELPQAPVQIRGKAGDVVLSHHQLVHGAAPNDSPEIRYASIYRFSHINVPNNGTEVMRDIWREWPGIADVIKG